MNPRATRQIITLGAASAVVGVALLCIGFLTNPTRAFFSYLTAFVAVATLAIGALIFLMIDHVSKATWTVVTRRLSEAVAGTLPVLALLVIPILFGLRHLYPWAMPHDHFSEEVAKRLDHRAGYANPAFFAVRQAIYMGIFVVFAEVLRRRSREQERKPSADHVAQTRLIAGIGIVVCGLASTWAGFDWLMSLEPDFWSTMWGFYFFSGSFVGAIGLVSVLLQLARRRGALEGVVTVDHNHALGRMLHAFVIFWAYIAFGQLLVIWIGDMPSEITFYVHRIAGSWSELAWALALAHFVIPFFALLPRATKQNGATLAFWGGWVVAAHCMDVYWMVMPMHDVDGVRPHWLDVAAFLFVGGSAVAFGAFRYSGMRPLPGNDPGLREGLHYEAAVR